MSQQGGETLFDRLEAQADQSYAQVAVPGISAIAFTYPNLATLEYVGRVFAQGSVAPCPEPCTNTAYTIKAVEADRDTTRALALEAGADDANDYLVETPRGQGYIPSGAYAVFEDGPAQIWTISDAPEIGLSTLLRRQIMAEHLANHPNLMPFHANAVLDTRDGHGIIFSSPDTPTSPVKGGKTTITLATVLREDSPFAYVANEDLCLAVSAGKVESLLMPAEINVGAGTYDQIVADGIALGVEAKTYQFYGETHYMTTAGSIEEAGFQTAESIGQPKLWCFVDLTADTSDYSARSLSNDEARSLFISTVKKSRLVNFHTRVVQGEKVRPFDIVRFAFLREAADAQASLLYDQLCQQGVQFMALSGGYDRSRLFNLVSQLC